MIITLTKEERMKLAGWLRQDIEVSEGMIIQMRKLGTTGTLIMIPHMQKEVEAFNMVAAKLEGMEEQRIG